MCTSFCFLALLELTWHGSLGEQAILNTSHINYWFLSKCNCSQSNTPFYNSDSKVSSFYQVLPPPPHPPATSKKWTDKKSDGDVNLRNIHSGLTSNTYTVYNSPLKPYFPALKAISKTKNKRKNVTLYICGHYKKQNSNKYGSLLKYLFKIFQKIMLTFYDPHLLDRNDTSCFHENEAYH